MGRLAYGVGAIVDTGRRAGQGGSVESVDQQLKDQGCGRN